MDYPLVNVYVTMDKSPFSMGKSTISMAVFNSKLLVYQRVLWKRMDDFWEPILGKLHMAGPHVVTSRECRGIPK
jgi:hypothetical protein